MLKEKSIFWLILLFVVCGFIHMVSDILFPFIIAAVIAYFLNPVVNRMELYRVPRFVSSTLVIVLFFVGLAIIAARLLPVISLQVSQFALNIPSYKELIHERVMVVLAKILGKLDQSIIEKLNENLQDITSLTFKYFTSTIASIWNSGIALVNIVSLIFVTPIITFYILRDWNIIVKKIEHIVPASYKNNFSNIMMQIDQVLSGFIRGQTNVCLCLAIYYSVALYIVGINFALFIGISTGILAFIPYVGITIGAFVSIIVALFQFGEVSKILTIGAIFVIGQFIEANFVAPKLVGEKIGLHPAWLFFILLAGGSIFGFTGILLAVPIGAVLGVLVRVLLKFYLSSSYYK